MGPLKHPVVVKKEHFTELLSLNVKGRLMESQEKGAQIHSSPGVCAPVMEQTHDTSPVRGNKGRSA